MLKLTANLDFYGNKALERRLQTLSDLPVEVSREISRNMAPILEKEARQNLQFQSARTLGKRSGDLLENTTAEARDTPRGGTVDLRTLFYGVVNARGATINAPSGLYLTWRVGDRFFKKRQVVIPARDWDALALERTKAHLPELTKQAVISRMRFRS